MHYNNWNGGVGELRTELDLLKTQVRKGSLNIAQTYHMITSVRTQPLFSFILLPERGHKSTKCIKSVLKVLPMSKSFPTLPLRINTQLYQIWLCLDSQHDSFDQFIFQSALVSYHSIMTLPCLVVLSHFDATLALRLVSY